MSELTIHHLARRQGHGLMFETSLHQFKYGESKTLQLTSVNYEDEVLDLTFLNEGDLVFMSSMKPIKPYLRPLSDIIKPIFHKGKKIVLIDVFYEMQFGVKPNKEFGFKSINLFASGEHYSFHYKKGYPMWHLSMNPSEMGNKFVNKLLEYHFVIDEPKGSYIEVTESNNPYK